jgi:tetratricopeptide (TPR) repeat protein
MRSQQSPPKEKVIALIDHFNNGKYKAVIKKSHLMLRNYPLSTTLLNLNGSSNAKLKKYDTAIEVYEQSLRLDQDNPETHFNLGNTYKDMGQLNRARSFYFSALRIKPNLHQAYNNLGNIYRDTNELDKAIKFYSKALSFDRENPGLYNNIGLAYHNSQNMDKAIDNFVEALRLNSSFTDAMLNLGNALQAQSKLSQAMICYKRVLEIDPTVVEAQNNITNLIEAANEAAEEAARARTMNAKKRQSSPPQLTVLQGGASAAETSTQMYKEIIKQNPNYPEAHYNLGNALKKRQQFDEAISSYKKAIAIKPNFPEAYNNIGNILALEKATVWEAIHHYDEAVRINPGYDEALANKAYALLKIGEFKQAWPLHEHRKEGLEFRQLETPLVPWTPNASSSAKPRVLVWAEQGIGDEIMFSSQIPQLCALCSELTLTLDKRLIPLFRRSFGDDINYVQRSSSISDEGFDSHILLGSLPLFFRNEEADFLASSAGFLTADPKRTRELRKKLSLGSPEQIIGISWRSENAKSGAMRTLELEAFLKPMAQKGVRFVNLQYGDTAQEIARARQNLDVDIVDIAEIDNFIDIDDLAALMSACDKVISSANATVHLAGALSKETHVLLPKTCDWRWQTERSDSLWYQSVKLYRQKELGRWDDVLDNIASHNR